MNPRSQFKFQSVLRARNLWRRLQAFLIVIGIWATQAATASAQAAGAAPAEGGKSYAIPWLVIVLVVALGVFVTLRPAGRAAEIKRDLKADL